MSVTETIQSEIDTITAGKIFGYHDLPEYTKSSSAVIKAVSRMVSNNKLERISKGKFYVPKKGLLGLRKPSDSELIRSMLYKNGLLRGYETGLSLYNKLGLTPQVPSTITIAYNGGRQEKDFGTIRVKTVVTRIPIYEKDVILLQYLDALKDIKKIPDSDINQSLKIMQKYISELTPVNQRFLLKSAEEYYRPQTKALVGLLFTSLNIKIPSYRPLSLNPTTIYKLNLDHSIWPTAKDWNIK